MQGKQTIILFDGVCNLCNGAVDFLLKKDRHKKFCFVPLQSETGKMWKKKFNIQNDIDSVIVIQSGVSFFKSDAAIKIIRILPFPWKILVCFKIIPERSRDKLYDWIAKNRYRWFGKRETCRII